MEIIDKIVEFDKYCKTCKHEKDKEYLDPCHECLNNPTNVHSRKPLKYEEDEEKVKKLEKETKNGNK